MQIEELLTTTEYSSEQYLDLINEFLGGALNHLTDRQHALKGRDEEVHMLNVMLNREMAGACLVGEAGVGKTAIVEEWQRKYRDTNHYQVFTLLLGQLASGGVDKTKQRLESLLYLLHHYQELLMAENKPDKVILFIDEMHKLISIFGAGNKLGGDLIKEPLARGVLPVISATTRDEYVNYIEGDKALQRRFQPLEVNELPYRQNLEILRTWLAERQAHGEHVFNREQVLVGAYDGLLEYILTEAEHSLPDQAEPARSIGILDNAVSFVISDGVQLDVNVINQAFKINNVEPLPDIDIDNCEAVVRQQIKGQPLAVEHVIREIKKIRYKLELTSEPLSTMLFLGPTGVGKTQMCKALATGIYGSEKSILRLDMNNYSTPLSETQFRFDLGSAVEHNSNSLVLLDEIEKAHDNIQRDLLPIIDEGMMNYNITSADGTVTVKKISLRNCIVIATTNAGYETFKELKRYGDSENDQIDPEHVTLRMEDEFRRQSGQINEALINAKFRPELLGRFDQRIPFFALGQATMANIARSKIDDLLQKIYQRFDIKVYLPHKHQYKGLMYKQDPVSLYVALTLANSANSNSGGARKIEKSISHDLYGTLIDKFIANPDVKEFYLRTNGNNNFETGGEAKDATLVVDTPQEHEQYLHSADYQRSIERVVA